MSLGELGDWPKARERPPILVGERVVVRGGVIGSPIRNEGKYEDEFPGLDGLPNAIGSMVSSGLDRMHGLIRFLLRESELHNFTWIRITGSRNTNRGSGVHENNKFKVTVVDNQGCYTSCYFSHLLHVAISVFDKKDDFA